MKKLSRILIVVLMVPVIFLSSCKKTNTDDEGRKTDPEFQTLTAYLSSHQMDLSNILTDWIVPASGIKDNLNDFHIIDIRNGSDYETAHIPGAVNSTLGNILKEAENAMGKPIIVVCYTGQTAGHAVVALRLSGYSDAKVLKWGMSGWGPTWSAPWDGNVKQMDTPSWISAPGSIVGNKEFDDPDLTTTATDGAGMLQERVSALLSGGFNKITNTDVLGSPGNYYINNFWEEGDVETYGNIVNAYRVKPLTISGEQFKYIDPSKTDVTYCWTGQTSSMVTAYLTVLGFDAKSMLYGVNGVIHDDLQAHKWSTPTSDLPVEP